MMYFSQQFIKQQHFDVIIKRISHQDNYNHWRARCITNQKINMFTHLFMELSKFLWWILNKTLLSLHRISCLLSYNWLSVIWKSKLRLMYDITTYVSMIDDEKLQFVEHYLPRLCHYIYPGLLYLREVTSIIKQHISRICFIHKYFTNSWCGKFESSRP